MGRQLKNFLSICLLLLTILIAFPFSACNRGSGQRSNLGTGAGGVDQEETVPQEPQINLPANPNRVPVQQGGPTPSGDSWYQQPGQLDQVRPSSNEFIPKSQMRDVCFNEVSDGNLFETEETFRRLHNPSSQTPPSRNSHSCFVSNHLPPSADLEFVLLKMANYALKEMSFCFRSVLAHRPNEGDSSQTISALFSNGRRSLLRCYWSMKQRLYSALPWREDVQRAEDSNNDLFYYLLLSTF